MNNWRRDRYVFADEWFAHCQRSLGAMPPFRRLRISLRRTIGGLRRNLPKVAVGARRQLRNWVPEAMKQGIKKIVREVKRFLAIGRPGRRSSCRRSDLGKTVSPEPDKEVVLSKCEYRRLVEDLEYWRAQADQLLEELEYLNSRNPKQ